MKLRITFELLRGEQIAKAIELEGLVLKVVPSGGWLMIEDGAGGFVVGYPNGVVRSIVEVGAFEACVVKQSENSSRRQPAR